MDRDILSHEPVASLSSAAWRRLILLWLASRGASHVQTDDLSPEVKELEAAGLIRLDGARVALLPIEAAEGRPLLRISMEEWSRDHYAEVYERDGHRCRYCGATANLTVDHVIPRCLGGDDDAANLVVACRSCNSRKSGRTTEQAGMVLHHLVEEVDA
jgi:hypothetical protein